MINLCIQPYALNAQGILNLKNFKNVKILIQEEAGLFEETVRFDVK